MKGRSNIENILIAQDTISDIWKSWKPVNVVIKVDIAKAYDKVEWNFFDQGVREDGFC